MNKKQPLPIEQRRSYQTRLRVGRLLFGEDRADAFARGAGEFGCRCLPMQ